MVWYGMVPTRFLIDCVSSFYFQYAGTPVQTKRILFVKYGQNSINPQRFKKRAVFFVVSICFGQSNGERRGRRGSLLRDLMNR
jgi:hypothetical protein